MAFNEVFRIGKMQLIKKHIGLTVILAILLVLVAITGLQIFITFITQLGEIGTGNYNLWQAILYVPLTLPINVYNLFPMIALLGCLLGLGHLASHRELIVMRASGVSLLQITWSVLRAAVLLMIVMVVIGEVLGPPAMHLAQIHKKIAKSGGQALKTPHGFWMRNHHTFIRIENVLPGKQLQGITQYQFNPQNRLISISFAKSASYQNKNWLLSNMVKTSFDPNNLISSQIINQKVWHVKLNAQLFNMMQIDPDEMFLPKLYKLIQYRNSHGLRIQSDELVFWQRIFQPFSALIMIFLSIPFIFGPLRSVTMGLRIVIGVLTGFSFYLINQFFGPFSLVYQLPPILGASLPSVLFLMIGFLFMRNVKG